MSDEKYHKGDLHFNLRSDPNTFLKDTTKTSTHVKAITATAAP